MLSSILTSLEETGADIKVGVVCVVLTTSLRFYIVRMTFVYCSPEKM